MQLLRDAEWTDRGVWVDNKFHMRRLLGWAASVSTIDEVRESIAAAVAREPDLLELILVGVSQQSELHDSRDWSRLLGIDVYIEDLPAWFPTSQLQQAIHRCDQPLY